MVAQWWKALLQGLDTGHRNTNGLVNSCFGLFLRQLAF